MRILLADKFPSEGVEELAAAGHVVVHLPDTVAEELPTALNGFDAVVVRSTRVTEAAISANDSLKLVVRAGAGTNTIDKVAAAAHSVVVCNTPGKNAVAVAELTMGLICSIDRNIPDNVADLRAGVWNKKVWSEAIGLKGRRLGIIGFGDIGAAVARRAFAFEMEIVTVASSKRSQRALDLLAGVEANYVDSVHELAATCDIITVHVPTVAATVGLIGEEFLSHVRLGAVIINTSRGEVLDAEALLAVIDDKELRVGVDVYPNEPGAGENTFDSALAKHPRVYGTHHIGASTAQAQASIAAEVVEVIGAFANGEIRNQVGS